VYGPLEWAGNFRRSGRSKRSFRAGSNFGSTIAQSWNRADNLFDETTSSSSFEVFILDSGVKPLAQFSVYIVAASESQ